MVDPLCHKQATIYQSWIINYIQICLVVKKTKTYLLVKSLIRNQSTVEKFGHHRIIFPLFPHHSPKQGLVLYPWFSPRNIVNRLYSQRTKYPHFRRLYQVVVSLSPNHNLLYPQDIPMKSRKKIHGNLHEKIHGQITGVMAKRGWPSPASQAVIAALQLTTFCESLRTSKMGTWGRHEAIFFGLRNSSWPMAMKIVNVFLTCLFMADCLNTVSAVFKWRHCRFYRCSMGQ